MLRFIGFLAVLVALCAGITTYRQIEIQNSGRHGGSMHGGHF